MVAAVGVVASFTPPVAVVLALWFGGRAWSRAEDLTVSLDDFTAAATALDARLDVPRDAAGRATLLRAYERARNEAMRRFGGEDRRSAAATLLLSHARYRLLGRDAAIAAIEPTIVAIARAEPAARRWGVEHLLILDGYARELRIVDSHFEALWDALAGCPSGRALVAARYGERLSSQGDLAGARELLARADVQLREPPISRGSPFRTAAVGSDELALRRQLSLLMAETFDVEGEFAAAWEVVRDLDVGADVAVLITVTSYEYDAGHYWSACERLRVAFGRATEKGTHVALALAVRLNDLGAVDASRAFLAEVAVDHGFDEPYRRALQAELDGDGTVPRPWSAEPALALVALAQAAHLRGDPGALELADLAVAQFQDARADHPHVSDALHVRAGILAAAGRRDDARNDLYRAITIVGARCGADHPQLVKLLTRLLELEHGDRAERIRLRLAALRVAHRFEDLEAMRPGPADAPPPT